VRNASDKNVLVRGAAMFLVGLVICIAVAKLIGSWLADQSDPGSAVWFAGNALPIALPVAFIAVALLYLSRLKRT
jgi:hypothetical protein